MSAIAAFETNSVRRRLIVTQSTGAGVLFRCDDAKAAARETVTFLLGWTGRTPHATSRRDRTDDYIFFMMFRRESHEVVNTEAIFVDSVVLKNQTDGVASVSFYFNLKSNTSLITYEST